MLVYHPDQFIQDQPHYSIDTNNLIEAWHHHLKKTYLCLMQKQHLDVLVYILTDLVIQDWISGDNVVIKPVPRGSTWRYLGIFFDHNLNFRSHVEKYSNKAMGVLNSMRLLGNSVRGLSPNKKRSIYLSVVLPTPPSPSAAGGA